MAELTKKRHLMNWLVAAVVALILLLAGKLWYGALGTSAQHSLSQYQQTMSLTKLNHPVKAAPDFTLIDQNGEQISLSSLHGKVVALEFMDPVCMDICPIISQEFVNADQLLGQNKQGVVFLAVNVNQFHESPSDVMKFSREHGLTKLPNWHFLTGSTSQLKAVWAAYGVSVVPNLTGDVQHSSILYFVDRHGNEAYAANPTNQKSLIPQWGQGIAAVAKTLL